MRWLCFFFFLYWRLNTSVWLFPNDTTVKQLAAQLRQASFIQSGSKISNQTQYSILLCCNKENVGQISTYKYECDFFFLYILITCSVVLLLYVLRELLADWHSHVTANTGFHDLEKTQKPHWERKSVAIKYHIGPVLADNVCITHATAFVGVIEKRRDLIRSERFNIYAD